MAISTTAIAKLNQRAVLVNQKIKLWPGSAKAEKIAKEGARATGADEQMVRAVKDLIKSPELDAIKTFASESRAIHRKLTLPWYDTGPRILTTVGFVEYTRVQRGREDTWQYDLLPAFARAYPDQYNEARYLLNGEFDPDDYPDPHAILDRFSHGYNVTTITKADDFRVVDLSNVEIARLEQQNEDAIQAGIQAGIDDIRERVREAVGHMASALVSYRPADGAGGKAEKVFRDSLVTNVRDLAKVLPGLDLTGSGRLDDLAARIESELCQRGAQALRDSEYARQETADAAESILREMREYV